MINLCNQKHELHKLSHLCVCRRPVNHSGPHSCEVCSDTWGDGQQKHAPPKELPPYVDRDTDDEEPAY